jgi:cytochrome P450
LQHFINEVLRLHPAIPFNTRVANKHAILPSGGGPKQDAPIAVHKGQTIAFSLYHMHRRVDLWGKDAAEFKPERWEQKVPAWQFLPFSGGPRICIGQQYSLVETSFLMVKLLRSFDRMEPVGWTDASAVQKGMGLTMWPRDGVHVRMHEATS